MAGDQGGDDTGDHAPPDHAGRDGAPTTSSGTPRPAARAAVDQEPETGEPARQAAAGKMPDGHGQPGSTTSQRGYGASTSARTSRTERATNVAGMKEAATNTRADGHAARTS